MQTASYYLNRHPIRGFVGTLAYRARVGVASNHRKNFKIAGAAKAGVANVHFGEQWHPICIKSTDPTMASSANGSAVAYSMNSITSIPSAVPALMVFSHTAMAVFGFHPIRTNMSTYWLPNHPSANIFGAKAATRPGNLGTDWPVANITRHLANYFLFLANSAFNWSTVSLISPPNLATTGFAFSRSLASSAGGSSLICMPSFFSCSSAFASWSRDTLR